MQISETLAQRTAREALALSPEPYRYDAFPHPLKVQLIELWIKCIGSPSEPTMLFQGPDAATLFWHDVLVSFQSQTGHVLYSGRGAFEDCVRFLENAEPLEALSLAEMIFQKLAPWRATHPGRWLLNQLENGVMVHPGDRPVLDDFQALKPASEAIAELNVRLDQHHLGYQFEQGRFIRRERQFLHAEVVFPALRLLEEAGFEGAKDEFARAHDHLRNGKTKEAVAAACQAFESVMKVISAQRGYTVSPTATAKPLLDELIKQGLIPVEIQGHIGSLRAALEQGLPTLRNRTSGHGQGTHVVPVPPYVAAFALHLAAANIVLLVEAHKANPV